MNGTGKNHLQLARPMPTPPPAPRYSESIESFLARFAAPEWAVDGILQRGYIYALTGPTGSGKTAIATMLEACFALGLPFAGRRVSGGKVLSLVGENPPDKQGRLAVAFQTLHERGRNIRVMAESFPLRSDLERIHRDADLNGPYALVVVDTSAAYFPGDDENDNAQMRQHAADLRALTQINGHPVVVVLAHPTKMPQKDNLLPRGGGSFLAEIDGNLTCWLDEDVASVHWKGKIRGPDFDPIQFRLARRAIDGMVYENGAPIESVVAIPIDDREAGKLARSSRDNENRVLRSLLRKGFTSVADLAIDAGLVAEDGKPQKSTAHRLLKILVEDKLVRMHRTDYFLTDLGKKEARASE